MKNLTKTKTWTKNGIEYVTVIQCYRFTRREINQSRFNCLDCGINIIKAGDYCLINDEIWQDQLHLGWHDNLCVAHIEKRLGRKLQPTDFVNYPSTEGFPMSEILTSRVKKKK